MARGSWVVGGVGVRRARRPSARRPYRGSGRHDLRAASRGANRPASGGRFRRTSRTGRWRRWGQGSSRWSCAPVNHKPSRLSRGLTTFPKCGFDRAARAGRRLTSTGAPFTPALRYSSAGGPYGRVSWAEMFGRISWAKCLGAFLGRKCLGVFLGRHGSVAMVYGGTRYRHAESWRHLLRRLGQKLARVGIDTEPRQPVAHVTRQRATIQPT
jgi:hypothetical protein